MYGWVDNVSLHPTQHTRDKREIAQRKKQPVAGSRPVCAWARVPGIASTCVQRIE